MNTQSFTNGTSRLSRVVRRQECGTHPCYELSTSQFSDMKSEDSPANTVFRLQHLSVSRERDTPQRELPPAVVRGNGAGGGLLLECLFGRCHKNCQRLHTGRPVQWRAFQEALGPDFRRHTANYMDHVRSCGMLSRYPGIPKESELSASWCIIHFKYKAYAKNN